VTAIGGAIASGTSTPRANVRALADTAAATATFPSTTAGATTTTVVATPTAAAAEAPVPTAPALASPDDVAAALRYLAAAQPPADPAPEPAPAPVAAPTGGGSVEDAIATYFGDVYDKAIRVARCESGLDPSAVSAGGGNWGLFQINKVHQGLVESMGYSWDQILDPYVNAAVARHIYDGSGWGPWGCRYA
jgi:hypothetical protein